MPDKAENRTPSVLRSGICTLFEGDFHIGLAAFLNSLVRAGYSGTVWAGYRGALPPWLDQVKRSTGRESAFRVADQIDLVFLQVSTDIHLTNYKPQFMLDLLQGPARDCEFLWYFDPDICLRAPWQFFSNWQHYGVALCQEIVDNNFPENSPQRREWMEIGAAIGLESPQPLCHYYNGGMVGVAAVHASFLEIWRRLIEYAGESGCDLKTMMPGDREMPFHASDQDALNIAAMYSQYPLSTLGPQGMGFAHGSVKMFHTVGQKPWKGSFFLRALSGVPPSSAMKFFLAQVDSPIRPYSAMALRSKRLSCSIAALIGRFYRRM